MTPDIKQEEELAEEKYGGNGWSEVEQLVLYRLDKCEKTGITFNEKLDALVEQRNKDVNQSRKERAEQFSQMLEGIVEIKQSIANDKLERVEKNALETTEKNDRESRLKRLETIVYSVLGAFGLGVIGAIVNKVF